MKNRKENKKITRRNFIKKAAVTSSAVACAPSIVVAQDKIDLKLATTWPPQMPILQESADLFSAKVNEATGGKVNIKVFAGGELIPPLQVFDAVSQGMIEIGIGAPYYWAGKNPAMQLFGAIPFGLNSTQFQSWLIAGGGYQLWKDLYAQYNLVPFTIGNTGVQMAGWFKNEIKSFADFKGLKIRIPGLGGKVLAKAGSNVVLMPGSDVFTSLERGTIDATDWISPFYDERMGLYKAAKVYHYPGWQEPQSNLELFFNSAAWQKLPKHYQAIIKSVAAEINIWSSLSAEAKNGEALRKLKAEKGVKILPLPDDALIQLKKLSGEVLFELADSDPKAKKIYESMSKFTKDMDDWAAISQNAYMKARYGL